MSNISLQAFMKKVLDEVIKEGHFDTAYKMLDRVKGSFKEYDKYIAKIKKLEPKRTKTYAKG